MKHIIPIDEAAFPETFKSLWLAGPQTGHDRFGVLVSRVPPGHRGPPSHVHPVDQFYFILKGTATVQIGTDVFEVGPETLVHFPAGTPHCNWNGTDDYEMHLELFAPAPGDNVISYIDARPVPDAARLIRKLDPNGYKLGIKLSSQQLATRATGSPNARIYGAIANPGAGGPSLHFHQFDQLYFILEGELEVQVGLTTMVAPRHSLVVLPAGTLHTNENRTAGIERHLTFLIPEPQEGETFDYKVDIRDEPDVPMPT